MMKSWVQRWGPPDLGNYNFEEAMCTSSSFGSGGSVLKDPESKVGLPDA